MTLFDRVEILRKRQNISQGKLEEALGFSNGSINKWKTSMPKADRLQVLAEYFGVSVDYLLTGSEPTQNSNGLKKIYVDDMLQSLWHSVDIGEAILPSGRVCDDERAQETLKNSIQLLMNVVDSADKQLP